MGELWGVYSVKIYCIFNVIARYIVSEMKQNVSSDRTYLWFQFQRWYSVEFPIMDFIILKQAPVSSVCIVVWGNGYFALNGCPVDILSKVFWLAFIWCCWRLTETEELNVIFCNVCFLLAVSSHTKGTLKTAPPSFHHGSDSMEILFRSQPDPRQGIAKEFCTWQLFF